MDSTGNTFAAALAMAGTTSPVVAATVPELGAWDSLRAHWPEYAMEAALLGIFMISACVFGAIYEYPRSPIHLLIDSAFLRRLLMGISMGVTATALIYSPWGKQSGAHINPSLSFTFFHLGKMKRWDAAFYVISQFIGGIAGVELVALFLRQQVSDPAVRYVTTVPGKYGTSVAFLAETLIAFGMMSMILRVSNHPRLNRRTGVFAGILVAAYITLEAPFSGMSMNPARTFGSAFPSGIWTSLWIYLSAPLLGMFAAAELHVRTRSGRPVLCCKLDHFTTRRCIFCGANGGFAS